MIQTTEHADKQEVLEIPCQFGVIDTYREYLAEFVNKGTIRAKRHGNLPPLFWDYTIVDEKDRILFTTNAEVGKMEIDSAINDYFGDGNRGRIDCLVTSHNTEIPAGMILSGDRYLYDNAARQLVFQKKIEDAPMQWNRIAKANKSEEHFVVYFGGKYGIRNDKVYLRSFSPSEKEILKSCKEFGLFFLSRFAYPAEENAGLCCDLTTCYPVGPPIDLGQDDFPLRKQNDISFGRVPWPDIDVYRQRGDVFISCMNVDRAISEQEATRRPLEQIVAEISSGTPAMLDWETFCSLFDFKRKHGTPGMLYGEFGALHTKQQ